MITRNTQVEEIVTIPGVISYFIERGVSPITCSGAYPQSLGRLLEIKKVPDPDGFIEGLNAFLRETGNTPGNAPD
jgi:hypothetical protein